MSPLDRKDYLREIDDDFRRQIDLYKDDTSEPKKVIIEFRNDKTLQLARQVRQVPINILKFRKNNGRISSDLISYESQHGEIDESTTEGQEILRGFLEKKSKTENSTLKKSLQHHGQTEPAIITCDGFLINGNRRKMIFDQLHNSYPNETKFSFLRVVILPGPDDPGGAPTLQEIEQVENRLQLIKTGKAEYEGFDGALSVRRKLALGISIKEQLGDNPEHFGKTETQLKNAVKKEEKEKIHPLECIDRYLIFYNRKQAYDSVGERWQAFVDYSNFYSMYLQNEGKRLKHFGGKIDDSDVPKIEEIAFKMIRKQSFPNLLDRQKLHALMRDLKHLLKYDSSREEMYKIAEEIPDELTSEEKEELGDNPTVKQLDALWGSKTNQKFTEILNNSKKYFIQGKTKETPFDSIKAVISKLKRIKFAERMNLSDVKNHLTQFRNAQDILDDLISELDHLRQKAKKGD